jgi:hypothetical protein
MNQKGSITIIPFLITDELLFNVCVCVCIGSVGQSYAKRNIGTNIDKYVQNMRPQPL